MSESERAICARVKQFREDGRWTQEAFAAKLGITRAKLVSIEHGWTPVRYNLAWRVARHFGMNMRWLATGQGAESPAISVPSEIAVGLNENGLFSSVYRGALATHFEGAGQFLKVVEELRGQLDSLCSGGIPDNKAKDSHSAWVVPPDQLPALKQKLKLLREYGGLINLNADRLEMEICETEQFHKTHPQDYPPQVVQIEVSDATANEKQCLTKGVGGFRTPSMPSLVELRDRLKTVTSRHGGRSALARMFGVSRQAVSQWISGASSPEAATTLRLLEWVTAEEAKAKTASLPKPAQSKRPKK